MTYFLLIYSCRSNATKRLKNLLLFKDKLEISHSFYN